MLAGSVAVARIRGANVSVIAQTFIGLTVTIVVLAVARFGLRHERIANRLTFVASGKDTKAGAELIALFARAANRFRINVVGLAVAIVIELVATFRFRNLSNAICEADGFACPRSRARSKDVLVRAICRERELNRTRRTGAGCVVCRHALIAGQTGFCIGHKLTRVILWAVRVRMRGITLDAAKTSATSDCDA